MKNNKLLYICALFLLLLSACDDDKEVAPVQETGTVTDIENNVYKTVKIGNQWWMAEDLKVTSYRNGNAVQHVTDTLTWVTDTAGACSDIISNQIAIGISYNWFAIHNAKKLAPEGWHIPTDEEWKELEKNIGMSESEADKFGWRGTDEGEKLKIEGPEGWTIYEDIWGTNESGFTALALGCRLFNFKPSERGIGATAFWWTSTEDNINEACYRHLDYKNSNVFRSHVFKTYGMSVRCVKD